MARREERAYWAYVSDEQRRQPGCPARELGESSRFQGTSCMMNGQTIAMPAAVDRLHDDDAAARVGALFDAHHQRLFRLARRLCAGAEDARDIVQETFLR